MRCPNVCGNDILYRPAAADKHAGNGNGGLKAISRHLHNGTAIRVLLQYSNGYFFGSGRFKDAVYIPCLLVLGKYRGGYSVRDGV